MAFEFDLNKSRANWEKHGIDFVEAQRLWADRDHIEIPSRIGAENRYLIVGRISEKCWTAAITYRSSTIRIISVRRARVNEVESYESRRFR